MNILVVGAGGLLGRSLVENLSKDHYIYACSRREIEKLPENTENIVTDLTRLDLGQFPRDVNAVFYVAQSNWYRDFPAGAGDMLDINVYAPLKIADWAQTIGVKKFIYASSGGVYKNPKEPVQEFFKINANQKNGFYLDSKLSAEILLRNYSELFETFAIVRPFFMYGPGQKKGMLIPRLIQSILEEREITLSGTEGILINPIYVTDAAKAMKNILNLSGDYLFNIAGNEIVSLRSLSEKIGKIVGTQPKFKQISDSPNNLVADITLMKDILHIPNVNLEEGLKKTFEWINNQ